LIVSVYVPGEVDVLVDTASVDDPEPGTEPGVNDAVAPAGSPRTLRLTAPANPLIGDTVVAYEALLPGRTVLEPGVAESEKSPTVIVRVTGALAAPAVSVTASDAV